MRRLRPATVYLIYETAGGFMFRLMATVYTVLILCSVFFLFPLYIMIITSLKNIQEIQAVK